MLRFDHFSGNWMRDNGVVLLCEALKNNTNLTELNLGGSKCRITMIRQSIIDY